MIWIILLDFTIFSDPIPTFQILRNIVASQDWVELLLKIEKSIKASILSKLWFWVGSVTCLPEGKKRVLIWKTCDRRSFSAVLKLLTTGCLVRLSAVHSLPWMLLASPPSSHLAAGHVTLDSTAETRVWSLIVFSLAVVCLCLTRTGIRVFWACGLSPFKFSPSASERRFKLVWTRQID